MPKIKLSFDEVTKKLNNLNRIIEEDINQYTEGNYNEIKSLLDSMDGETKVSLLSAIKTNEIKIKTTVSLTKSLVDFLIVSSLSFKGRDDEIGLEIRKEAKNLE